MKTNVGKLDRIIRIALAIVFIGLTFFEIVPSPYSYIGIGVSIILIMTAYKSFCPIYFGLNLSSKAKEEK